MGTCWRAGNIVQVAGVAIWQVRNSTLEVRRGEEFSVTCVVTSLTPIDVVRVVLHRPGHHHDPRSPSTRGSGHLETSSIVTREDSGADRPTMAWTVADNYDVKEPFSSLPRYRIYYSYNDGVATSTLVYRGTYIVLLWKICFFSRRVNSTTP